MSRLVEAKPRTVRGAADFAGDDQQTVGQKLNEYGERVAKYVPAEVLAFYAAAVQLISTEPAGRLRLCLFVAMAIVGWIVTPIWLGRFSDDPTTRVYNQRVGFVAFLVWVYAYPAGVFQDLGWYNPVLGGLALLTFSLISALLYPKK